MTTDTAAPPEMVWLGTIVITRVPALPEAETAPVRLTVTPASGPSVTEVPGRKMMVITLLSTHRSPLVLKVMAMVYSAG